MLKTIARLESVVNDKVGHFLADHDTPVVVAKEMCLQFIKYLEQIEEAAKAQQSAPEAPKEEAQPE